MRLLLYNIRYGLGFGSSTHLPVPGVSYLLGAHRSNLQRITDFINSQEAAVGGLVAARLRQAAATPPPPPGGGGGGGGGGDSDLPPPNETGALTVRFGRGAER